VSNVSAKGIASKKVRAARPERAQRAAAEPRAGVRGRVLTVLPPRDACA
jgi:hypothetical protein